MISQTLIKRQYLTTKEKLDRNKQATAFYLRIRDLPITDQDPVELALLSQNLSKCHSPQRLDMALAAAHAACETLVSIDEYSETDKFAAKILINSAKQQIRMESYQ